MAAIPSQVPTRIHNSEKEHPFATTLTQSHSNISKTQLSGSPKSWEKPGAWGSVRRGWRNVQRYIWDDPEKPVEEKRFLRKLDFFLRSYTCLGYFCKNLDQANISNAYVSGTKEALGMHGSQLTYMGNVFTAGYVVGQIPAVILVTKIRPSILVSSLEVLWAVFTFCCAAVTNTSQLYALRFLIDLCEGAFFPCIIYLIGSWSCHTFYSTATLATMFSGYLQAGAYKGLNGVLGRAENTRAFYLTVAEVEFARNRLLKHGYKPLGASAWNRKKILLIARQWQFWLLPIGYFFVQSSFPNAQPVFALYLKATHHSVYEINVWPTGQAAVGVVVQILAGMLSDSPLLRGRRWQALTFMQLGSILGAIIIAVWSVPTGLLYFGFYTAFFSAGVPGIYYSWFPDLMPHDHEMRRFITAFSNMFSYINQIWVADAVWRTVEAPKFRPGYIVAITMGFCLIALCLLINYLEIRDTRRREIEDHEARPVDIEAPVMLEAESPQKLG